MSNVDRSPGDPSPADPSRADKDLAAGPPSYTRETFKVTPARVGLGVLAVLVLILVIQNGDRVDFRFFMFGVDRVPLWIVITAAIGLGVLIGLLVGSLRRRRRDRRADRREDRGA